MTQANNPLHGIKLETIVNDLVDKYGWEELGSRINIRCFNDNPSVKSSLKFLRKTEWARDKVEYLWLKMNKLPLPAPKPYVEKEQEPSTSSAKSAHSNKSTEGVNASIWGK
ncbi:VF530 family protein [Shewanella sp. 1_MG-2023]|uniref:VF530 family protein n=1 Tax=unclassified Shewanella TaxID=196818 RepID=UPI0026E13730|nr:MULTISPECIES: VF530 family protein [unclassified Shewanella]MDO6611731.1 VF530 family protein [Shewanella sp. 7_MG-2023]MDO6771586.1 VF530 family protein [Shewanella sp. 2_MG-2023]MDO6793765.1 VF530 family protein [Shewanella sp. 1_MG-2023]